jgi:hypothetical protein
MTTDSLTRAIHQRMSSLDDAELLRLWVENDRGQYSDAAFEAVRAVLTERGVELPAQNDPPPMAKRLPPGRAAALPAGLDAASTYWSGWLRPMLWVGVVLGAVQFIGASAVLWSIVGELPSRAALGSVAGQLVREPQVYGNLVNLVLATLLLLGIWNAMRLRRAGRHLLLVYAWFILAFAVLYSGGLLWAEMFRGGVGLWALRYVSETAHAAAYPLVLLLFLRRPEIKALFERAPTGFDVQPSAAVHSPVPGASRQSHHVEEDHQHDDRSTGVGPGAAGGVRHGNARGRGA